MNKPPDRRRDKRITAENSVFIEYFAADTGDEPQIILCSSLDISSRGIQIKIDQSLPIGTVLRLCIDNRDYEKPLFLVGEVRWKQDEADGCRLGFELYDAEHTDFIGWQAFIDNQQQPDS